jgi:hypothetical protein
LQGGDQIVKLGLGIASNAEETARAIERDYRMTAAHQWARELLVNSQQAGARKVVFGFHAASAVRGVWRMQVSDDGCGMDADEIVGFFKSYGASGKAVGGEHDNMGIGAKTSLLPWEPAGPGRDLRQGRGRVDDSHPQAGRRVRAALVRLRRRD